jgi:hypothetical protein
MGLMVWICVMWGGRWWLLGRGWSIGLWCWLVIGWVLLLVCGLWRLVLIILMW